MTIELQRCETHGTPFIAPDSCPLCPMTDGTNPIVDLLGKIRRGELESQASQSCAHERVSNCGGGMSGFCLDCGDDMVVRAANDWLQRNPK